MKRLRLIKPWRLRAVRQRVNISFGELEYLRSISRPAPDRIVVQNNLPRNVFNASKVHVTRLTDTENHNQAPHSDVIFVCSNRNIR
jgi:hypothetical protein